MKRSILAFMAGLLLLTTRASAETKPGGQLASLSLGLSNPLSNETVDGQDQVFGKIGPTIGFDYLYQLQKVVSIGGDFNYKSLGTRDIITGHGPAEVKSSAWTLLAVARGDLMPDSNLRPYGLLGMGVGGVRSRREYGANPGFNSERTSSGLAFALGAGADFDLNASWLAGAELRYNIINTSEAEIGTSSVSTLDVMLKLGYKF
ncbi:MAG: outer membrane beta-barrel protein [Elusimicrobiota bacterium]